MTNMELQTIAVLYEVPDNVLSKIKENFKTVHYYPKNDIPEKLFGEIEVFNGNRLPDALKSLDQVKKLKLIQLISAGANNNLTSDFMKNNKGWNKQLKLCTASGIHSLAIPQYVLMNAISLHNAVYMQTYLARKDTKWFRKSEMPVNNAMTLYERTVGLLGYGSIAREIARQFKAMNCKVIAANSSGSKKADDGFIFPGTGDADGSIPDEYYSTTDEASFNEFLSKTDILVGSLPSTPQTHYMLKKKHFDMMPDRSMFINIGRGDLAPSDDIIAALDAEGGLNGVALDVTDPEPLPANHPLFTHPKAIITPHTSGDYENYNGKAVDLLIENVKRARETGKFFNIVEPERGY